MNAKQRWQNCRNSFNLAAVLAAVLSLASEGACLYAAPVNPAAFQAKFDAAKKDADVVADVRVITVVCTEAKKEDDKVRSVTLQVAMQVLTVEKGPVKKNEIVVVSREVHFVGRSRPGGCTASMAEVTQQFPFTPGVKGSVALRWDKEGRAYAAVAGWVPEPNNDSRDIPKEVGKAAEVNLPASWWKNDR